MKDKNIVEFQGVVVANPYNSENYKVYGLSIDTLKYPKINVNKYFNVSITGNMPNLEDGVEYYIKAEENMGKHGYEYKIINIKRDRPKTEFTTRLFLQEILESESHVNEIMREYPDIIDRVINNRLDDIDLSKLYNIGEFRFNVIKRKIVENFALAELVDEFKGLIEFKILKILFDKYESIEKIKESLSNSPYKCLCGLSRIAFKTADKMLLEINEECKNMIEKGEKPPINFGYDLLTSYQRQKAAVMFLLDENENNGNTRIDIKELRKQSETLANKCIQHFVDVIKNDEDIYFDKNTMTVALQETYEDEKYIANKIFDGLKIYNKWNINTSKYKINCDITLTDQQYKILPLICNDNITILNGFAGSGKSATTKSIIDMLDDNNKSFLLLSPTGRAAKVLSEYTKKSTFTIHRGLAYMPPEWGYNEFNKLREDIVIVDETSMVDIFLMKKLLEAIDFNKTKLLLIGDSAQILSVGAGNIFYDLINSNKIKIVSLTQIFRYGDGGILTVATKTRESEEFLNDLKEPQKFGNDNGYMFIPTQQEKIINNVMAIYKKLLLSNISKEDIMVLSAYNKGEYGTVNINKHLQPIANPNLQLNGKFIELGENKFYEDDLIIQTVNNYKAIPYSEDYFSDESQKQIFIPNGEIGRIIEIRYNSVIIKFSNDIVIYAKEDMQNIKLAYSISLHKSQGAGVKIVILITPKAHTFMLNSNLVYVGQTRAKEKVYHFGEIETVNRAIKKKADFNRNTFLLELLNSCK